MEFGEREEIRLLFDGSAPSSSSSLCQCRICHEEEEESCTSMESPCACSGSLKFAHRGCIQRWCDEKGSTVCEICLEKFEPGYTVPPKITHLIDVVVTIRASLEVPRRNYEPPTAIAAASDGLDDDDQAECSSATERGASCCRTIALIVTIMLLIRHLILVLTVGADHYAFTLFTVLVLRASGILLPFFLVMRMISAFQRRHRRWRQLHANSQERDGSIIHGEVEEDAEPQQHRVQIQYS